jgi:hypothetical protein
MKWNESLGHTYYPKLWIYNHPQDTKQPLSTTLREPIYGNWWSIRLTHHSYDLLNPLEWSTQIWNLVTPKFTRNPLRLNPNTEVDWRIRSPTRCQQRQHSQPSLSPTLWPCPMQLLNPNAGIDRWIRPSRAPQINGPNPTKRLKLTWRSYPSWPPRPCPWCLSNPNTNTKWLHTTKSMTQPYKNTQATHTPSMATKPQLQK